MLLLHPIVIPARPPEYDCLSMTGGIVQRNYATNEIAIMDTKKMYCLQVWKLCTVAGGMCFHGELPYQKDLFPSGQTPRSLASASCSSHERSLPIVQMPHTGRYNTSCAQRGSSTPGLSHATLGLNHGGGTYYHSGNSTPGRAQRGRSSRRRIRWPWWLEPSSNASTPTPTSSTSSRFGSGSSRPRSVGRFKTALKPVPFINLESQGRGKGKATTMEDEAEGKDKAPTEVDSDDSDDVMY
jgi:hypothetical protein